MAFIDYSYEKAFDSVKTSAVMQALRQQGVDELYIEVLEETETARQPSNLTRRAGKFPSGKVLGKETQSPPNYSQHA